MSIYARKNLIINAFTNVNLLQPLANGDTLIYDAAQGTFTNAPIDHLVSAQNLGTGIGVFDSQNGGNLRFDTIAPGANIQIVKNGNNIIISSTAPLNATAVVLVVANIAARDALIPALSIGSQVFVQDTGQGEHAFYMWDGTTFVVSSTQDSAASDANTMNLAVSVGLSSPSVIGRVGPGHRITLCSVKVLEPFDDLSAALSIGDDTHGSSAIMDASFIDLTSVGDYNIQSDLLYGGSLETEIKAYFNFGLSTVGQAQILISYV